MKREYLPVNETFDTVCRMIADRYESENWKYLVSKRSIKKVIQDLVFEIRFFGSKWNMTGQSIRINGECSIWYKKMDKKLSVKSSVGCFSYRPDKSKNVSGKTAWEWDITYKDQFLQVAREICNLIDSTAIPLTRMFESDFTGTVEMLARSSPNAQYVPPKVNIEFIDICSGRENAEIYAQNYFASLNDAEKERFLSDLELYENGMRNKAHMINPCTFKYIADNNIKFK